MRKSRRNAAMLVVAMASLAFVFGVGSAGAAHKVLVSCGSTVDSNVTLQADLNCTDTTGLEIGSDKVTVNLNGHTITDTDGGGDGETGIDVNGHSKVTIKNGTITNFAVGIYTDEDPGLTVQGVTIWLDGDNGCGSIHLRGIWLVDAINAQIKNVTVNNTGAAVLCGDFWTLGIYSYNGDHVMVSNSTANGFFHGFTDFYGHNDTWSTNTAHGPYDLWDGETPSAGFTDYYGGGNSYVGDTANAGTTGFYLLSALGWVRTLKNSTANGNSDDGAYMFESNGGPGTIVTGNTFNGNGNEGMHGAYNDGMVFSKNTAVLNGFDPWSPSHGNGFNFWAACDAKFSKNTASSNYSSGFRLGGWCGNETADQNVANNNQDDGFHLNSNTTCQGSFKKNEAFGNGDYGAIADSFFIPGLKNTTDTAFYNVNITNICN